MKPSQSQSPPWGLRNWRVRVIQDPLLQLQIMSTESLKDLYLDSLHEVNNKAMWSQAQKRTSSNLHLGGGGPHFFPQ